jgi:hypothetical protein
MGGKGEWKITALGVGNAPWRIRDQCPRMTRMRRPVMYLLWDHTAILQVGVGRQPLLDSVK